MAELQVLAANNLRPLRLRSKEGLALINGTQMVSALGAEGEKSLNGVRFHSLIDVPFKLFAERKRSLDKLMLCQL